MKKTVGRTRATRLNKYKKCKKDHDWFYTLRKTWSCGEY